MIRTLHKTDIAKILPIEQSVHVAPWDEDTFKLCFQAGYFGWAAEADNKVIGFIVAAMNREECHILNICVALPHQHTGWGTKLLEQVLKHAKQQGVGIAYLEVRRSNTKAIAMYKKMEFIFIGERKEYYPTVNGHEDALIFAKSLQDTWDIP